MKNKNSKLSETGRWPDGSLRFTVRLPSDIADAFEREMKLERRKKDPMAVWMISEYLKKKIKLREAMTTHQRIADDKLFQKRNVANA